MKYLNYIDNSNRMTEFFIITLTLKDIATVSSDVTFRSRIEASVGGNVRVIQMKDLGDNNFVLLEEIRNRWAVHAQGILMRMASGTKGQRTKNDH